MVRNYLILSAMLNNWELQSDEELTVIFNKILEDKKLGDFITYIGNGIYKVDYGNGNILYTGINGVNDIEASLNKEFLTDDTTTETN